MRSLPLFLGLPILILAGCGGNDGGSGGGTSCPEIVGYLPNAAYTGHFAGYFSEPGAAVVRLSLDFVVASDGSVTGSATDVVGASLEVTGRAVDLRSGCDDTQALVDLTLSSSGGSKELFVLKKRSSTLLGNYAGSLTSDGGTGKSGTLVVSASGQ